MRAYSAPRRHATLYRSTADPSHRASFREAVLRGTPPGGGLYVPTETPRLSDALLATLAEAPSVSVVVLYPAGRVSALQEKQFASLGGNVHALRVAGSFDDCQRLVKAMFADEALRETVALTSANSISVARLVPQTFYYGALAVHAALGQDVEAVSVSDDETEAAMRSLFERTGYTADPHTAVGVAAWARVRRGGEAGVVLSTAHPAKFPDEVERVLGQTPETPERLARLAGRPVLSEDVAPDARALRSWLAERFATA